MNDLLKDFESYFTSLDVIESGKFFRDTMPDMPDSLVCVFEYSGQGSIPQIQTANRSIQIAVRDKNATVAMQKAKQLYGTLITEDGILSLTEVRWCMVHLRQTPFKIRVDEKGRSYYGFNVGVTTYID